MRKVFQTEDGRSFNTAREAAQWEAVSGISRHVTAELFGHSTQNDVDVTEVVTYLLDHSDEIQTLVQAHKDAKNATLFTFEEIYDWTVLEMFKYCRDEQSCAEFNQARVIRCAECMHEHLLQEHDATSAAYSDMECELSTKAWTHFKR